ncbi:hypothetical protein [Nesterenkonia pannonica]|uniref:hypothetical protein n=1 Tax=Nesterenkonia pannonica TaxID=1548602 RepID=UPI0021646DC7|nr:hypothetical protein [Nesterenkonia pannonica]
MGGVTAGMAFIVGWSLNTRMANIWMGQRPALQQVIDTLSLVVMHSSIAVMASLGIFRVFQEAFIGLTVDHIAGSVLLGLVGAVSGYFAFNSGARLTAFSLSTILAIFMASGILISTLFAENPYWWHVMFSELGTGQVAPPASGRSTPRSWCRGSSSPRSRASSAGTCDCGLRQPGSRSADASLSGSSAPKRARAQRR